MKKLLLLLVAGCLAFGATARAEEGLPPYDVFLRYYLNMRTGRGSVLLPEDRKGYVVMVYFFVDGREVNRHDLGLSRIKEGAGNLIDAQLMLQYTPEQRFISAMLMVGEVKQGDYGNVVRDNLTTQINWWSKINGSVTMFKTGEFAGQYNGYDIVLTANSQEPAVGAGKEFFEKYHLTVAVGVKSNADPMVLQNEIITPKNILESGRGQTPPPAAPATTPAASRGNPPATPPPARPSSAAGARPGSPGSTPAAPASGGTNILQ